MPEESVHQSMCVQIDRHECEPKNLAANERTLAHNSDPYSIDHVRDERDEFSKEVGIEALLFE